VDHGALLCRTFLDLPILTSTTEDINPDYAIPLHDLDANTSPSKWLNRKKALEAVYKALFRYIREQCETLNTTALEDPIDFNAIAEHNDKHQTFKVVAKPPSSTTKFNLTNTINKLLTIFLMAAVKGARIAHYVEGIMTKLDKATQAEIAVIIQEVLTSSKPT
jgi:protein HOOK3